MPEATALVSSVSTREPYYDGIRALGIATVMSFHWLTPYVPLFGGGYVGVDVFFVLSGFIITRILWRRESSVSIGREYARFLRDRVRRLYPALIALTIVGVILLAIFQVPTSAATGAWEAALALLQTASVVEGLRISSLDIFSHTWSLSVEWCFYLLWPIVLIHFRRRGIEPAKLAAWCVLVAIVLWVGTLFTSPEWFYFGPSSRAAQLLTGCAFSLWALSDRARVNFRPWMVSAAATAAIVFILLWTLVGSLQLTWGYRAFGFPAVTLAAVVLCSVPILAPRSRVRSFLAWRPFAIVGLVSYSLYLFHLLGIEVLDKDKLGVSPVILGAAAVVGTTVLTTISYRFLEQPFMSSRAKSLGVAPARGMRVAPTGVDRDADSPLPSR